MNFLTGEVHQVRKHRPFIDGMRAIAILAVIASHLSLPGFAGGFVGVDIFFVISGYLIINQIVEDIGNKRFGIFEFYSRRAFRILPAFFFVLISCLVLATVVFIQPDLKDFARSFFFSSTMTVNHYFLRSQGYFDAAALTKPLLHMWTLAVEEQFYLVTPLILIALTWAASANRFGANRFGVWVAATCGLGILSFVACVAFTFPAGFSTDPAASNLPANFSFYLMPLRGWEFILGGAAPSLAFAIRRMPTFIIHLLAIAGACLIAIAVFLFDADMLYPSYRAAVPTIGAALIIVTGLLEPRTIVARALASWPMVPIGLVSYSWYLWHWPLISFVRSTSFGEQSAITGLGLAVSSLGLAILTYHWIEQPFRRWGKKIPLRPVYAAATAVTLCIAIGELGFQWSSRIAPLTLPALAGLEAQNLTSENYPPVSHRGILLGDSHAFHLQKPLGAYARRLGSDLATVTGVGCPPLLETNLQDQAGRTRCNPFFHEIAFRGYEFAIFAARWNFYLGLPQSDPFDRSLTLVSLDRTRDSYQAFATGLEATIADARHSGIRRILLIAPPPEFPWYAPYCVMRAIRLGIDLCKISRENVELRRTGTMSVLQKIGAQFKDVRVIDPIDLFCTTSECRPNTGKTMLFSDTNHLSPAGIEIFYDKYRNDFEWVFTGGAEMKDDEGGRN